MADIITFLIGIPIFYIMKRFTAVPFRNHPDRIDMDSHYKESLSREQSC